MITVQKINETTFEVTVESRTNTTHRVTVEPGYCDKLTGGEVTPEPNTSILRSFDLPVIGHYFPEYERTIRGMLR